MTIMRNDSLRAPLGLLCFVLALACIGVVGVMAIKNAQPVSVTDAYDGAQVTFTSDRTWVLFPGDCVAVEWNVQNVASATFYPRVEPGIPGGYGVRSIFFSGNYHENLAVAETAAGGTTHLQRRPDRAGLGHGLLDYTTQPKLRIHFADTSSRSYTLGLDVLFLRVEVCCVDYRLCRFRCCRGVAIEIPSRNRAVHLGLWLSAAFLLFYSVVFLRHPDFLRVYVLDAPIFFLLVAVVLGFTALSVFRPAAFDDRIRALDPTLPYVSLVHYSGSGYLLSATPRGITMPSSVG